MIKKIITLMLLGMPLFACSQDKKSTKQLEEQVRVAKAQQEAAQKANQTVAKQPEQPYTKLGANLVPLKIITPAGTMITQNDLPKNQPILLVLFNPMCDHCQKVATDIKEHIKLFKDVTIVFLTGLNLKDELKSFIDATGIGGIKNFIVGGMEMELSAKIFMMKGIPQIMAYNKNRILQKTFFETLNVDSTLHCLHAINK